MVKVRYIPPPFGPATSLNRPPYGPGNTNPFIMKISKMHQGKVIGVGIVASLFLAYIPYWAMQRPYPRTMSPDYEAATRAYMRYHNMNPISSGISSKKHQD